MNNYIIVKNKYSDKSKNVKYHRKCDTCGKKYTGWGKYYCSKKCRRQPEGKNSSSWKGDNVGYASLHEWVLKNFGKPTKCKKCNSIKNVEWSNDKHDYKRTKNGWTQLCRKCHFRHDFVLRQLHNLPQPFGLTHISNL